MIHLKYNCVLLELFYCYWLYILTHYFFSVIQNKVISLFRFLFMHFFYTFLATSTFLKDRNLFPRCLNIFLIRKIKNKKFRCDSNEMLNIHNACPNSIMYFSNMCRRKYATIYKLYELRKLYVHAQTDGYKI